ncbi:hypothetical protein FQN54_002967 [Arachnomyces sp. PD_36]|nr:hypothetical protein FQN54_002967 [Arachnomyces sp. PD_36]
MTDTSSVATTQPIANQFPVTAPPLTSPVPNGTVSDAAQEDEPYTIKCICAFQDDDGHTVFCETCETWQHIECYYHGKDVPEIHTCADCEPRVLDAKRATERQRRLREQSEGGDRKPKRSGAKNQRKKAKDGDASTNGYSHQRNDSNSTRDQPPSKKVKTSHRASGSLSSLPGTPTLQSDSRKRAGSTALSSMSPTKPSMNNAPPPSPLPLYSSEFLELYDRDTGNVDMQGNLFDTLSLLGELGSWVRDPLLLPRSVNVREPKDVFTHLDYPLDPSQWPAISCNSKTDTSVEYDGKHPTWKYLNVESDVRKDDIVGEVKGKVGPLRNYCLDPNNRWKELRHPEPFVFFHPQLPLYIDSRKEGTKLRYVRRSCRPNVTLKTFITNGTEYHFCFVANQDIPANAEITAMWYLDPEIVSPGNGLIKQEGSLEGIQDSAAMCLSNILAHFGGCACDPSQTCLLSGIDRRRRPNNPGTKQQNGRRKKNKSKQVISPMGTGRANNSRAGSENIKNNEDEDQGGSRSTSGSVKGQPHSRDQTPNDATSAGGTELSERDRRKIAAVEKKFEQLEHGQQHQKKKKRSSGTSTQITPTVAQSVNSLSKPLHLDTAVGRSTSPPSRISPNPRSARGSKSSSRKTPVLNVPKVRGRRGMNPRYVDSEMQTDPDHSQPSYTPPTPRRTTFVPLTQRLLKRCHEDRVRHEERSRQREASAGQTPEHLMSPISPVQHVDKSSSPMVSTPAPNGIVDTEMKDAPTEITPPKTHPQHLKKEESAEPDAVSPSARSDASSKPPLPPLWPSTAAHNSPVPRNVTNGLRSELRVQLPPPQLSSMSPPSNTTPSTSSPPVPQSAFGVGSASQPSIPVPTSGIAAPSPVKKKLSLGDYLSRKNTLTTPTTEKTQSQVVPPPSQPSPSSQPGNDTATAGEKDRNGADEKNGAVEKKEESSTSPDSVMKDAPNPPSSLPFTPAIHPPSSVSKDPRLHPS